MTDVGSADEHSVVLKSGGEVFAVAGGDTVLRAALRAGIGMSYECNSGSCGTCKVTPLDGQLDSLVDDPPGLSARDVRKGRFLACQSIPVGDGLALDAQVQPECVPRHRPQRMVGALVHKRDLSPDLFHLAVGTDTPAQFRPGQYAMLSSASGGHERAFSMANVANDEGRWEFIVRLVDGGAVSPMLHDLKPGEMVSIDGPYGLACLDDDSERDLVCVGAGSGLAPVVSALAGAAQPTRSAWVVYRDRAISDNEFLWALAPSFKDFTYRPSAATDERDTFFADFLTQEVPGGPAAYDYYAAGPPDLIRAIVADLVGTHKVPVDQIHFDLFWPTKGAS